MGRSLFLEGLAVTPDEIAARLWGIVRAGLPVVMVGVGSRLTAAGAARGGAHLIAAYSTAVYRCREMPSVLSFLPYGGANALALVDGSGGNPGRTGPPR